MSTATGSGRTVAIIGAAVLASGLFPLPVESQLIPKEGIFLPGLSDIEFEWSDENPHLDFNLSMPIHYDQRTLTFIDAELGLNLLELSDKSGSGGGWDDYYRSKHVSLGAVNRWNLGNGAVIGANGYAALPDLHNTESFAWSLGLEGEQAFGPGYFQPFANYYKGRLEDVEHADGSTMWFSGYDFGLAYTYDDSYSNHRVHASMGSFEAPVDSFEDIRPFEIGYDLTLKDLGGYQPGLDVTLSLAHQRFEGGFEHDRTKFGIGVSLPFNSWRPVANDRLCCKKAHVQKPIRRENFLYDMFYGIKDDLDMTSP